HAARAVCHVPLVASGGAGAPEHFREAFAAADVDGALAASVFHSGTIAIPALKQWLRGQGICVRPPAARSGHDGGRGFRERSS
ncbi:MAG: HisA/HisF-related TIM barrel protein, partial [Rhodanobacteraceae bacterium]